MNSYRNDRLLVELFKPIKLNNNNNNNKINEKKENI